MKRFVGVIMLLFTISLPLADGVCSDIPISTSESIVVPSPDDFVNLHGVSNKFDEIDKKPFPDGSRRIGFFATESDRQRLKDGKPLELLRYCSTDLLRGTDKRQVSPESFRQVTSNLRQKLTAELPARSKNFRVAAAPPWGNRAVQSGVAAIEENSEPGFIFGDETAWTFAKINEKAQGSAPAVLVSTFALIKGKIVLLTVASISSSDDAMLWAKRVSLIWLREIRQANP